jgi:hypothetical protein
MLEFPFGIFYGHLVYFMVSCYVLLYTFPVLVCFNKHNLATLPAASSLVGLAYLLPKHGSLRGCRTSFDTASPRRRPDELRVRRLLDVFRGVQEADASGAAETSMEVSKEAP